MQNTVTTALFLTLSLLLITLIPEGVLYGMQLIKAHDFASSTVELAEKQVVFSTRMKGKRKSNP